MKQACTLVMLLALAACAGKTPTENLDCPNVAVLEQANSLTQYEPGEQGVAAQITQARITGVTGACALLPKRHMVRITFRAGFSATNGPANHGASLSLPYFVSLSEGDSIISKTPYAVTIAFDGNVSTASATSAPITIDLPNTQDTAQTEILVAFQLNQDQLAAAVASAN